MTSSLKYSIVLLSAACLGLGAPQEPQRDQKPDDLAAKLIRKTIDEGTPEDPMLQLTQDMGEIAKKLQIDFDPGEQTQAQQRQVSAKLDEAIKAAAARRRLQNKPDPKQQADKRTMPAPKKSTPQPAGKQQTTDAKAKSASESGTDQEAALRDKEKKDAEATALRRAWGNLPQRDREEVLQGADEESLERFRQWIDQYFRALQESNR